jgi:serine/threonine-protein phosphatase Stp1
MSAMLRIDDAAKTDTGCVRKLNEDSFCSHPEIGFWAIADGMGGHEGGERASAAIVAALDQVQPAPFDALVEDVANAIHGANGEIYAEAQQRGVQMGSTAVALVLSEGRFGICWAGDSRAYLLRDELLHQLTIDHTQVQAMLDRGVITPAEAKNHPMKHVLSRAVGVMPALEIDAFTDEALPGDIFLLCSDGLTAVVAEEEIGAMMHGDSPAEIVDILIAKSIERGAPDNVTICVVAANETTQIVFGSAAGAQA